VIGGSSIAVLCPGWSMMPLHESTATLIHEAMHIAKVPHDDTPTASLHVTHIVMRECQLRPTVEPAPIIAPPP
jgi:hypothetical protein